MIQFNQQYIRDYFKPFIQEVLTDMSTTTDKGDPLYKIKNQIQVTAADQEEFEKKYFLGQQPANRPFTGQDEGEYRKYFMEELTSHVNTMIRLSSVKGMQEGLLPDAETGRTFGSHQKLTENLNRLSIKLARNFEKRKIKANLVESGELTEEKQRRIENGEMKLIEIDGKEAVKTEEEITEMARKEPQKLIVPSTEPEIEKTFDASPEKQGPPQANPEPAQKKAVTVTKVKDDFDAAKIASVRETLVSSGLEVVGTMSIENSVVSGKVRDVEGQELKVSVDTSKPNYAADKFVFIFTANGPHPELEGSRIPVSQDDLQSTFLGEEGERKPAEKVFKEQDAYGTRAKGKYQPQPKPDALPKMPLTKLPERQGKGVAPQQPPEGEQGIAVKQTGPGNTGEINASVGVTVTGGGHVPVPAKSKTPGKIEIKKKVADARVKGPQPVSKSIMKKKREMAEQKQAALAAQQQQGKQQKQPDNQQKVPVAQPQKKKGMPGFAKLALGTGSGGIGAIISGAYWAATSETKTSELAIKVILSCLGIDCLA